MTVHFYITVVLADMLDLFDMSAHFILLLLLLVLLLTLICQFGLTGQLVVVVDTVIRLVLLLWLIGLLLSFYCC